MQRLDFLAEGQGMRCGNQWLAIVTVVFLAGGWLAPAWGQEHGLKKSAPDGGGGPDVGQPAPDFKLKLLEGKEVQLSSLKGKPVVLVFGSCT